MKENRLTFLVVFYHIFFVVDEIRIAKNFNVVGFKFVGMAAAAAATA